MTTKLILNEEIKRILEVMNVNSKNSKLLTESIIDDVIGIILKYGAKSGDDVATSIKKIESQFGVKLDVLDIKKLVKGDTKGVLIKIINSFTPKQLSNFTSKVWNELPNLETKSNGIVGNIVKSKKTYTSKNLKNYLNDESKILIPDQVEPFQKVVIGLRKKFITDSFNSLKNYGVINDITTSAGKSVDNVASKVSDVLKIDMSKDNLLKFIDDEFPGNTLMKQDIEKISDVDLKKSQDEFNKLSDAEVDDAINKVCGTIKEFFGKTYCDADIKDMKTQAKGIRAQTDVFSAKEERAAVLSKRRRRLFINWVLVVGIPAGVGTAYYYGKKLLSQEYTDDLIGCMKWARSKGETFSCEKDSQGKYILYNESNDESKPVEYKENGWSEI
jgi:hypothetical protein